MDGQVQTNIWLSAYPKLACLENESMTRDKDSFPPMRIVKLLFGEALQKFTFILCDSISTFAAFVEKQSDTLHL